VKRPEIREARAEWGHKERLGELNLSEESLEALRVKDPSLKKLFQFLAGEEAKHKYRLEAIYDIVMPAPSCSGT
jgi:hypothetical protein